MHVAQEYVLRLETEGARRFCHNDMHKNKNLKRVA
jgi:hypothetical protein